MPEEEVERRAWATVNAMHHGGEKPGGDGYRKTGNKAPTKKASDRRAARRRWFSRSPCCCKLSLG
jgi:hypothetical protein